MKGMKSMKGMLLVWNEEHWSHARAENGRVEKGGRGQCLLAPGCSLSGGKGIGDVRWQAGRRAGGGIWRDERSVV
eukprot:353135-Chlamydomonas_euryale.AAC.4